ncbi:MAG: FliH/SctL family protein [Alphaproteobacteria bacterium]|nr:FliH/SctL family protein [Alphaproteobacteria bacterium]
MSIETKTAEANTAFKTAPARKFMFDYSFDNAKVVHRAPERKAVLMKPDQIDAFKKEAYEKGFAEGKMEGKDEQIAQQSHILDQVGKSLGAVLEAIKTIEHDQELQTRQIALAIARKILPSFVEKNGPQEIESLIDEALRSMGHQARLIVRLNESQHAILQEKIQAMAKERAFPGELLIQADPAVTAGDCRIEWTDGGIERNVKETVDAVEKTILPSS